MICLHQVFTLLNPFSLIARIVLFVMGWSPLTADDIEKINKYPRTVVIFSHSTYADFCLLLLYMMAHPNELGYVRTLVKPQPFKRFGTILRRLGAIPSTRLEDSQGGAVNRIVNELKEWDRCIFLISPKGSIVKREWRTGYYHIARELDAHLRVAGLDYEKKCTIVSNEISSSEPESKVREFLQNELKEIVPLFPNEEVVPIRSHDSKERSITNGARVFSTIIATIILISIVRLFMLC